MNAMPTTQDMLKIARRTAEQIWEGPCPYDDLELLAQPWVARVVRFIWGLPEREA